MKARRHDNFAFHLQLKERVTIGMDDTITFMFLIHCQSCNIENVPKNEYYFGFAAYANPKCSVIPGNHLVG